MKKASILSRALGAIGAALVCLPGLTPDASAQQIVPLLTFTNAWRYDQSGTDLGTNWREPAFVDVSWPSGLPLFGLETNTPFPYITAGFNSITTPLDLIAAGRSAQTITYYFRTHFNFPGTNVAGVVLTATAYVDDGCVLYLNGSEAGRARVPAGQNWQTVTSILAIEGAPDPFTLPAASLHTGDNVLAVEVHQAVVGSSDVAFALSLAAALPGPLLITNQPRSQTIVVGDYASFTVGVSGGSATYQWRTNGVNIPGAVNATYAFPAQLGSTGIYSVVASNVFGAVISEDAVLTVLPDTFGPRIVGANVIEASPITNTIQIFFTDRLTVNSVHSPIAKEVLTNGTFLVTLAGSSTPLKIFNSVYNAGTYPVPGVLPSVFLRLDTPTWLLGSNYILTVNRVRDFVGNVIAPDSRVSITWPRHQVLVATNATWKYHAAAVSDPAIFSRAWTSPGFVPGPWWSEGVAPFNAGPVQSSCMGIPQTQMAFQSEPTLFRIPFVWSGLTNAATLQVNCGLDDGLLLHLNGNAVLRFNVAADLATVLPTSRSIIDVNTLLCFADTVVVTNLVSGTNWFAAAVLSADVTPDGFAAFGCNIQAAWLEPHPLPPDPAPQLGIQPATSDAVALSWVGRGYALESSTNFSMPSLWREVTNMSNPFTNTLLKPRQFFRLHQ